MTDTVYYLVRNGLGNIIQTTPTYKRLSTDHKVVVVTVDKWADMVRSVYHGYEVIDYRTGLLPIVKNCSPYDFRHGGKISEVERNLQVAGFDYSDKTGFCGYEKVPEKFDILVCDGYNKRTNTTDWLVKSYSRWNELVPMLSGSIASIGTRDEYIPGTVDKTGIGLLKTFGLIRNAKLLITNDTGFYHAACAFGTRCIVLFTMTDQTKNYDPVFHRSATIVTSGLECQPCQLIKKSYWITNKRHCHWKCRDIPPEKIIEVING